MSDTNLNDLQQNSTGNPSPQNSVFSEIVKEVFGDIQQYETDVPQNFSRPCFLFINPDKTTRTKEMTASSYKAMQNYEIYFFATEDDVESLTSYKDSFVDYLMGVKKVPIPGTDRYYTVEQVAADTDDVNSMVAFMIEVSRVKARNLRRPAVPKIRKIVNSISVDGRDTISDE
ncbi:phage tail terminator family protein [Otoolea muris]|uniref:phage tail terminator family protein n=1 Tax=Otoolea muris TaxID=2941515 RepID=UPI00203E08F9|nr:hypothetical protein [Otoolea muris]